MRIDGNNISIELNEESLVYTMHIYNSTWIMKNDMSMQLFDRSILPFQNAQVITHTIFTTGLGVGIRSTYTDFPHRNICFQSEVWIEHSTDIVRFTWIPIKADDIQEVNFPAAMMFDEGNNKHYSLCNLHQGILLPNTWAVGIHKLNFNGQLCSCASYMPWFAQVREKIGYIAIHEHPWDGAYTIDHPMQGPYTHLAFRHLASLGTMQYPRTIQYQFSEQASPVVFAKRYREYAKEHGLLVTLKEKAILNPKINSLIGCAFVHKGIKTHVQEGTLYYDKEDSKNNNCLTSFEKRAEEVKTYKAMGIEKLYYHLDGWTHAGYDNEHPDVVPPCEEAGGYAGMRLFQESLQSSGYLFGIHDQYRDYYFQAPSFQSDYATQHRDGSIHDVSLWAGGRQSYLCASQAPAYVKRNFTKLKSHGIQLDAAYLDVFTCNEADECHNPKHPMSRKECLEYRNDCFRYLRSQNVLPSSEEVSDWSMPNLVFAHYAPYLHMMSKPDTPRIGIPIPLFNLVYHDCVIIPWSMEKRKEEDNLLYALLNGGAAYLEKEGAYPNCDGVFPGEESLTLLKKKERYEIVKELQEQVAFEEMVNFELLNDEGSKQRSTFANGIQVSVDFIAQTYTITKEA